MTYDKTKLVSKVNKCTENISKDLLLEIVFILKRHTKPVS